MMLFQTWNEAKAAGKHLASYAAGGVTVAVAWGLLSTTSGADINADINLIADGTKKVVEGTAGIIAVLTPIYTAWRAAHNASPDQQQAAVAARPDRMVVAIDPAKPAEAAMRVASLPEIKAVITNPEVAAATPQIAKIVSPEALIAKS